jgi:hypothetical protein
MTTEHIATRTTANGTEIRLVAEQAATGTTALVVYINGQRQRRSGEPAIIPAAQRARQQIPAEYSHMLAGVALTRDEVAAYAAVSFDDPQARRRRRADLVRAITAAQEAHDDARAAAWDRGDIAGAMADDPQEIADLRAELAAFDAAHPEVAAALAAERAAAVERAQWH